MISIYTDGSSKGNPGPGGWGAIIVTDDNFQFTISNLQKEGPWVKELGGREEQTTNNRMELTAAIEAIRFVSELPTDNYVLSTDSKYVMLGITQWVHNWQKKGWKTSAKKAVLNQDLWQELLRVSEGKSIEWKYVAGHVGHVQNERADTIATSFADREPVELYEGPRSEYKYR